jgi:hypothetical protein
MKPNLRRWSDVSFEYLSHLFERVTVFARRVGGHAVTRHAQVIIPHIGIVCGEEHAIVSGNPGQNQCPDLQVLQQDVESRGKECRMFGLQHKIIIWLRMQQGGNRLAADMAVETVLQLFVEIRLPAAEIVVDINGRTAGMPGALLQLRQTAGHRQSVLQQLRPLGEFEVIDDIDQQQRDLRLVRDIAVEVFIFGRHVGHPWSGRLRSTEQLPGPLLALLRWNGIPSRSRPAPLSGLVSDSGGLTPGPPHPRDFRC